jgi:hypothetical protein
MRIKITRGVSRKEIFGCAELLPFSRSTPPLDADVLENPATSLVGPAHERTA